MNTETPDDFDEFIETDHDVALGENKTRVKTLSFDDERPHPKEKLINFEHHSQEENHIFSGVLHIRKPSISVQLAYESELARRNAGVPAGSIAAMLAEAFCNVKYYVVNGPDWLKAMMDGESDVSDMNIVLAVSREVVTFLNSFRRGGV